MVPLKDPIFRYRTISPVFTPVPTIFVEFAISNLRESVSESEIVVTAFAVSGPIIDKDEIGIKITNNLINRLLIRLRLEMGDFMGESTKG